MEAGSGDPLASRELPAWVLAVACMATLGLLTVLCNFLLLEYVSPMYITYEGTRWMRERFQRRRLIADEAQPPAAAPTPATALTAIELTE